jgi:hypothetical protein
MKYIAPPISTKLINNNYFNSTKSIKLLMNFNSSKSITSNTNNNNIILGNRCTKVYNNNNFNNNKKRCFESLKLILMDNK